MRLSELLGKTVVDQDGRELGEVHDVAATQDGPVVGGFGAALRVDALVVGMAGLWARIGFSSAHISGPGVMRGVARLRGRSREIPWDRVVRIDRDRLVVRVDRDRTGA
jgi:sporulation protein YlmC with PRC-barrel domain